MERVLTLLSNTYPLSEFLFVKLERLDGIMDIRGGWKAGGTGAWAWGEVSPAVLPVVGVLFLHP